MIRNIGSQIAYSKFGSDDADFDYFTNLSSTTDIAPVGHKFLGENIDELPFSSAGNQYKPEVKIATQRNSAGYHD
jgi:hypothetical protein